MEKNFNVSEIFVSLQGEGKYLGYPMIFIRLSGCTRACSYCDTKYHTDGKLVSYDEVGDFLDASNVEDVCFTGGEPLIQWPLIKEFIIDHPDKGFHIETNGDLFNDELFSEVYSACRYLGISPKEKVVAEKVSELVKFQNPNNYDIKVVTDLETEGVDMLEFATSLMPLSTFDEIKDREIAQKVWQYCVEHQIKFTPRAQISTWGKKTGI